MKRITLGLLVISVALILSSADRVAAQRHRGTAASRTPPTTECSANITNIADCPEAGCGENGDSELNRAKNRIDVPGQSDIQHMTFASMRSLAQPLRWNPGDDRSSIKGPGKEGTHVDLKGFLIKIKPEGGESCNCGLTRRVDTDVHLALVAAPEDGEETSVTAELTPRVRANGHPDWLYAKVKDLEGEFIRVTGWLMLDTKHIRQTQFLPNEHINRPLTRATNWEVHPVLKLEVCHQSIAACNANQGWEEF